MLDADCLENRDARFVARLHRVLEPLLRRWFRPEVRGLDRIPPGPSLLVGNHNGAMLMPDLFVLGLALYERFGLDGLPYGLAHRLGIELPGVNQVLCRIGGVRGTREHGTELLERGHRVLVYPGGELDSMRPSRHRHKVIFGRRRGYARMAIAAGAPVVPFVTAGAHETLLVLDDGRWLARTLGLDRRLGVKTWPISLSVPWGLWIGVPPPHLPPPTKIRIEVLEPIRFERSGPKAAADGVYVERCHRRVHFAMEAALARLVKRGGRGANR